jgi:hypothetical protein
MELKYKYLIMKSKIMATEKITNEINDAVYKYYKYKEQYENEKKITMHSSNNKPYKFKCVSCRRYVGSIFKNIFNADKTRSLIATCGSETDPCLLDINIQVGSTVLHETEIEKHKKVLSKLKQEIICDKNNVLFGYTEREIALEKFNRMKEQLENTSNMYEYEIQLQKNIVSNVDNIMKTTESQTSIIDMIQQIKQLISMYKTQADPAFISESVELYINKLLPELSSYREFTKELTEKDYEDTYKDPSIVSFKIGPRLINTKRNKTLKHATKRKSTINSYSPSPPIFMYDTKEKYGKKAEVKDEEKYEEKYEVKEEEEAEVKEEDDFFSRAPLSNAQLIPIKEKSGKTLQFVSDITIIPDAILDEESHDEMPINITENDPHD